MSPPVLLGIWTRTKDWRLDNKLIEDLRDEVAAEKLGGGGGGYRAFLRLWCHPQSFWEFGLGLRTGGLTIFNPSTESAREEDMAIAMS